MIKLVVILLLNSFTVRAAGFACFTDHITIATPTGTLPAGENEPILIPKGTNCTFTFDIPSGYAVQVKFSVDLISDNDTVTIVDNTNKARQLVHSKTLNAAPVWLAANTARLQILGASGQSKFFATYQFQSLNGYKQVKQYTGQYFKLSQITKNTFHTIYSVKNEMVVATYGKISSSSVDGALQQIFVYDGADIMTSKMIGTLEDIGSSTIVSSSKNALTLVNFYNTLSSSYVLGNDASTVSGFGKYYVIMSTSNSGKHGTFGDITGLTAGYTFICTDCNRFYLTQWTFVSPTVSNLGYSNIRGQTPTHKKDALIRYDAMTFTRNQLPQLIPTNTFTITVYLAKVEFNVNTVPDDLEWKTPYDGRKGYMFSPNLWNENANPNVFNYEFRNNTQLFNFALNIDKMQFGQNSDNMTLVIGSATGNPIVNNQYPRDSSATGKISSNGNYMQLALTGSQNDDIRLSFEMKITSSSSSIGTLILVILAVYAVL